MAKCCSGSLSIFSSCLEPLQHFYPKKVSKKVFFKNIFITLFILPRASLRSTWSLFNIFCPKSVQKIAQKSVFLYSYNHSFHLAWSVSSFDLKPLQHFYPQKNVPKVFKSVSQKMCPKKCSLKIFWLLFSSGPERFLVRPEGSMTF